MKHWILRTLSVIALVAGVVLTGVPFRFAQAGAGTHLIYSSRSSCCNITVQWQKDSGSLYTDLLAPGTQETEDVQHPNAEPYRIYVAKNRCVRYAIQANPYGDWICRSKLQSGQWWSIHPGDGYSGNWQTIVQIEYYSTIR